MKSIIDLTQKHLEEILKPDLGATVLPLHPDWLEKIQQAKRASIPSLTKAKSETLVSNYSYACIDYNAETSWSRCFAEFAYELGHQLSGDIGHNIDLPEPIQFDDLYFTKYEISEIGVGPHRDVNCKNLVVVLVLEGTPAFYICKDKGMSGAILTPAKVGDLMIMRAKSFLNLTGPIHYVGAITQEPMLQLGLRQYIEKPKK